MNKSDEMKKYIGFIIAFMALFVTIMTGCGGTSADFVITSAPEYLSENIVQVNPDGSVDGYTQSGVSIKAERNTFASDVKIKITENKAYEGISGLFHNTSNLFTISAEKIESTSFGEIKSKVTNIQKPAILSIPNDSKESGVYYIGTRANSSQPWKYTLVNDGNSRSNPLPVFSRASANNIANEFYVSTYNVDFQFAVFVEKEPDPVKTVITDLKVEAAPAEYELVNGLYKENLNIKATVFGDNLGVLTSNNFVVEIGFLNDDESNYTPTTFPISGAAATHQVSEKDAGAGNKYKHTVILTSISDYSNNTLSFGIGASNLSQQVLPDNFTVTVKVNEAEHIVPFEDTKSVKLTNKTPAPPPTPVDVTATMLIPSVQNASINTNVVIAFSDSIEWNQDSESLVTLYEGNRLINCDYSYSLSHNLLTLTPKEKLAFNAVHTVTVSKILTKAQNNQQFEFTTVESAGMPSITPDLSKSSEGKFYLVADQKFYIDFNKVIINEDVAKSKIYMKKNDTAFTAFSVELDTNKQVAAINVNVPFEADQTYIVGVSEFSDSDGSVVKTAESSFEAMPSITVESIELDYGNGWQTASGSTDVAITGKIRITLNHAIEPFNIKLVNQDTPGADSPLVYPTTDGKTNQIEYAYSNLNYVKTYGILISYNNETTGQKIENDIQTFLTLAPTTLVLANPMQPNSKENPYLVYTANALDQIRKNPYLTNGYYFKQMADIDLSPSVYSSSTNTPANGWKPLGYNDSFVGHYDGNNKNIINLKSIGTEEYETPSLFGAIENGSVKNLAIIDVDIQGICDVAAIAGYIYESVIDNCHSSGNINAQHYEAGGLVGYAEELDISNSYSEAKVTTQHCFENDYYCTGGLIAYLDGGTVTNCYATGNVEGTNEIGGLIGSVNNVKIEQCFTKNQTVIGETYIGGLIGYTYYNTKIKDCYCQEVTVGVKEGANGEYVGGLVGRNENSSITGCNTSGSVTGNDYVGGVAGANVWGWDTTEIRSSGSECTVIGHDYVGGVIGINESAIYSDLYFNGIGPTGDSPEHTGHIIGFDAVEE